MKEMPPCVRWQRWLTALTNEEELSCKKQAALKAHITECATCAQLYQRKQNMLSQLRGRAQVAPLSQNIAEQIRLKATHHRDSLQPEKEAVERYSQESSVPLATKTQRVYNIDFSITCPKRHSELLLNDLTASECLIEELSAYALTTLFEQVWIKSVAVSVAPAREVPVKIALLAQGITPLLADNDMNMVIEDKLTCALAELFDTLHVEHCVVA